MAGLGVEYGVKYTLTGPDGTKAVFNDESDPDYVGILNPEECSGLDSPDVREDAVDATEADGGVHGDFFFGRRPVVLAGIIRATSATQRNERAAKIQAASKALRSDATLKWTPTGGSAVELQLRRQQPVRIIGNFVKKFQIPLVSAKAEIEGSTLKTSSSSLQNTGEKASSTWSDVSGSGGSKAWSNPSNAATSNNSYAAVELSASGSGEAAKSKWLVGKNFGFAIPNGAKIIVWQTLVESKVNTGTNFFKHKFQLLNSNGEIIGPNFTEEMVIASSDAAQSVSYFSSITTTAAEANDVDFGVAISVENKEVAAVRTYSMDIVKLTLQYFVPVLTVVNEGNADAYPEVIISGPITTPIITHKDSGKALKIEDSLVEGETITIDFRNHTIVKNGTTNIYNKLDFDSSDWWALEPGSNEVEISMTDVLNSKFEIKYRDTWL